ncbi:hypothetical protein LSM04_009386 [Trypanosoma melophagium]|uniref:uncharacterized protein n=1 Tax=Trypanosoma melophagium TaxID=715481 RepID=UPI00351A2889|nr:hypothetical protein LSM04_009386 [Trypanosoma melophagium]
MPSDINKHHREIGVDRYALEQELRTVIEGKTRLAVQVDELQRELAKKLQLKHGENNNKNEKNDDEKNNNENMHDRNKNALAGMGIAAAHIKMLEKENKMLRAKYLLYLNHEQREQQKQKQEKEQWTQVNELSLQSKMASETLIDSVRLSSPGLIRAL